MASFPTGARGFSRIRNVERVFRSYAACYPRGTEKRRGCETDHSPSTNAKVKTVCSCTSTPAYAFASRSYVITQFHEARH